MNPRIDREQLDEIVDILLETVCTSRKSIRVAGDDYPAELVKAKFLKLDSHHIEFVMDCLRDNTTKVRNIKQYLRAMLFNAPSTINSYYASLVAHDMAPVSYTHLNLPDVGELVQNQPYMDRQPATVFIIRTVTQQVDKLALKHSENEVECGVRAVSYTHLCSKRRVDFALPLAAS